MSVCRICGRDKDRKVYIITEMMIGIEEDFVYTECDNCGCLQLEDENIEFEKYYPREYYSLQQINEKPDNFIYSFMKRRRARYALQKRDLIGRCAALFYPVPGFYDWIRFVKLDFADRILDIGCGSGRLLLSMRKDGFTNLTGLDPYVERDIDYGNGLRILRGDMTSLKQKYDFIMMNHSFEHMKKPEACLRMAYNMLKPNKYLMIRTPVVPCFAFRKYGRNWVQLDAPRHIHIFSKRAIDFLAERTGFKVQKVVFDSTELQFWGSEQYKKGVYLLAANSYHRNPKGSQFSKADISLFRRKAEELNRNGEGDQAIFYLYRI